MNPWPTFHSLIIRILGPWLLLIALLPHNRPVVSDAPDAMGGDELRLHLRFYLHPTPLQVDDFVPLDSGPVARSAPIDKFHAGFAKIELGIMPQTQGKGVTGSHNLTIPLWLLAPLWPLWLMLFYPRGLLSRYPTRQAPFFRSG